MLNKKTINLNKPLYRQFLNTLQCVTCGQRADQTALEAAHISKGSVAKGSGMSRKANDNRCLPLCHNCHREQHSKGEVSFWYEWGGYERAIVLAKELFKVWSACPHADKNKFNDFDLRLKMLNLIVSYRRDRAELYKKRQGEI